MRTSLPFCLINWVWTTKQRIWHAQSARGGILLGQPGIPRYRVLLTNQEVGACDSSPSFSICLGTSFTRASATFFADFGLNESLTPVHTRSPSGLLVAYTLVSTLTVISVRS